MLSPEEYYAAMQVSHAPCGHCGYPNKQDWKDICHLCEFFEGAE